MQSYSVRTRVVVSVVVWLLCLPAVVFYFLWVWQVLKAILGLPTVIPMMITVKGQLMFACGVLAWGCLLVTNIGWLRNHKLPRAVPVAGGIMACVGIWPLHYVISFAVPAILFATYLLVWTFMPTPADRSPSRPAA